MGASKEYLQLLEEMKTLHMSKANGYSGVNSEDTWRNFRLAQSFNVTPVQGVFVRMSDKWSRLQSLWQNPEVAGDEAIEDTLMDLASYALIAICLINEHDGPAPLAPNPKRYVELDEQDLQIAQMTKDVKEGIVDTNGNGPRIVTPVRAVTSTTRTTPPERPRRTRPKTR